MHKVIIDENSFLYKVYKERKIDINSYHKQAIKDVAPGFKVTAISEDGIVEGIQKDNIIAVQWHPEVILDMKLFETFIKIVENERRS